MSKQKKTRGKTSFSLPIFIRDTSSTTGAGLGGVTSASIGLILEFRRQGESAWTPVSPVAGKTLGSFLSGGIVADGALVGAYEVDFPNAAYASAVGVEWVALRVRGVANMLPALLEVELDAVDYQDPVRFGITAMPNVTSGSAGSLLTSGTGTAQLATSNGLVTLAPVTHTGAVIPTVSTVNGLAANVITAAAIATDAITEIQAGLATAENLAIVAGYLDTEIAAIKAKTDLIVSAAAIAAQVWSETIPGSYTSGQAGGKLNSAGAAGDPWSTSLPGSYAAGTAGYIVGVSLPRYGDTQRWTSPTNTLDVSISKV